MEFTEGAEWFGRPALSDEQGRVYELKQEGFISLVDVSLQLLGKKGQYGCRFVNLAFINHPDEQLRVPNLGVGLRVDASGVTYDEFAIHPDDVEVFVNHYQAYEALVAERAKVASGENHRLSAEQIEGLGAYLVSAGISLDALK